MSIHWRKFGAAITLGFVLLSARPGQARDDALSFFKNYFITGGYQVAGIGLSGQGVNGIAQGMITINGVPEGAELVAAFLYAQVVSADGPEAGAAGVTFHGVPLSTPEGSFGVIGDPAGATPCWSSGGGTGQAGGTKRTYSYRYDVLRFLPVVNGRQQANGDHPVGLPDLGNSNATPIALGASLVLIYRDPDMPLSAFVIYDGSWAMDNATQGMTQTIEGFYDPAPVAGEITHIVGSGQANKSENLRVNGTTVINPFQGFEGEAWDNVTVVTPNLNGADTLETSVDNVGFNSFDCLTWSAVIYRTEVNDSDLDGLLDAWEMDSGLTDPNGVTLPDLAAMGADPYVKDLFIEVGYMKTDATTSPDGSDGMSYGGIPKPHHTHLPTAAALLKVGTALAEAGINVHFDVGQEHQGVPGVIPSAYARGGEAYDEMITVCEPGEEDPPWVCQFSEYPGTVGWKSGFRTLRDALINDPEPWVPPEGDHVCDTPTNPYYNIPPGRCDRVFDRNRKDIFRYVFFAHALGVPKANCLDLEEFVSGEPNPNFGLPDANCQEMNPLFNVPNTYTGVADWGGGDAMVTMGGFMSSEGLPVGTDNQQAGTILHELGHTLMLRHGGASRNPNCGPNYLSVMNYLFQLRGLVDENGELVIGYSGQELGPLDESVLVEKYGIGSPLYRAAWYAPFGGIGSPATRHCNGSAIEDNAQMIRVEGTNVGGPIDWNANGNTSDNPVPLQDINFDGVPNDASAPLNGFNDWDNLRLNQVGSRRNIGVWFFADGFPYIGPASLDMGRFDFGRFDFGRFDFGRFDFGRFDFGRFDFGDLNLGDLGRFDFGRFDFGRFDFGRFDFGVGAGDLGRGADGKGGFGRFDFGRFDFGIGGDGQLTAALAVAAGLLGPPTHLTACVVGHPDYPGCDDGDPDNQDLRVLLAWLAPDASPSSYVVYRRAEGEATFAPVGNVERTGGVLATTFVDSPVDHDTTYTYYVAAKYVANAEVMNEEVTNESASNTATVTTGSQLFGFRLVRPRGGKAYNAGSSVPIEWELLLNGVAVNSFDAEPEIIIEGPSGEVSAFTPEDPGNSSFHPPTENNLSWQFNWQTNFPEDHPTNAGEPLPHGSYDVKIKSLKTGQTFPSFEVELKSTKKGKK